MAIANQLGRLEQIKNIRSVWPDEARDFTPWLAREENLALLSDTIGIELECQSVEKAVGPFSADILCKDTVTDQYVLIENQIERTDHAHLGQLLTYAAGLHAVTIVWIAKRFTEEHRAAMNWLNEITGDNFNFFGLEIELWQIGSSPIAPKFNIIAEPNDWVKSVQASAANRELTDTKKMQLEFWTSFTEYMESNSHLVCTKPAPRNWMNLRIGTSYFFMAAVFNTWDQDAPDSGSLRAELLCNHPEHARAYFDLLFEQRADIERELNAAPVWYAPENGLLHKIFFRKLVDVADRDKWPEYMHWLREHLEKLHAVFAPRVKRLDIGALEVQPVESGNGADGPTAE